MSALQYKSKIKTPGEELGNEVVLTSPTTGRLNLGAKTETNHTRDNDVLTFDNLLKCSVELVSDGTGAEPSTTEDLTYTKTYWVTCKSISDSSYIVGGHDLVFELGLTLWTYDSLKLYYSGIDYTSEIKSSAGALPNIILTMGSALDQSMFTSNAKYNWKVCITKKYKLDK